MAYGRDGVIPSVEDPPSAVAGAKAMAKSTSAEAVSKPKAKAKALAPGVGYGGMSDASKRRLVYDEFELINQEDLAQRFIPGGALVPFADEESLAAVEPTAASSTEDQQQQPVIVPQLNYRIAFHGSRGIPVPLGMDDASWGQTVNEMPKYKDMELSYNEMAQRAAYDAHMCKYLLWLRGTYGQEGIRQIREFGTADSQGYDLGAWLLYVGFEKQTNQRGFTRRLRQ